MDLLRKQFLAHVGQTSPSPLLIEVERAEGVYFYTPAGKRYFDLISGVTVNNVGHANPVVIEAVKRQAERYMHTMVYGELVQRPQVEYAALISSLLPQGLDSVYFLNSGSEAVEGALKLAKRCTGRTGIVCYRDAYHGSTHGSLSVMGGEEYKNSFRPLLPDITQIGFNDMEALARITERTAAVIVDPVQSEAGVRIAAPGYFEALRRRCDRVGAMLIFDEIQSALGRCGAMFAFEKYGVVPDILCLAKALGGGMPLGAFIASKENMDKLTYDPVLGHISTFGGHPVCCAAGMAALRYTVDEGLCQRAETAGALYEELLSGHPAVQEIRRNGLLLAVELGSSSRMMEVLARFKELGILSDWFLFCDTAFRISPPLTITQDQVRESVRLILQALG
ncbi:MAG: aminotransferase class III-fold pyridoxal phosphate-dependent enzyme [Alistipes sp.]|nr:aminotransferase class III-fold pyridoxal phosphate-dependent enzyme [Alistipes sp.]